jgi:hypothetical protein
MPANTHVHDCSLSWLGTPNTHVRFNNYDLKVDTLYYMLSLNFFLHLTAWYTSFNNYDLKLDRLYYMLSLNFFLHLTASNVRKSLKIPCNKVCLLLNDNC